jgi:hypothetical protein
MNASGAQLGESDFLAADGAHHNPLLRGVPGDVPYFASGRFPAGLFGQPLDG